MVEKDGLTELQGILADYMASLSERAYCAVWMSGLEYALWEALIGARGMYGSLEFHYGHIEALSALSEACDGWIVWDDGVKFLPMAEWLERFANR